MFTRLIIDAAGDSTVIDYLDPVSVKGPYWATRVTRTIVHDLLQSSTTRTTHLPVASRKGSFVAVFESQEDASAALEWFAGPYLYLLTRSGAIAAETLFAVTGGELEVLQNLDGSWDVTIPYKEVVE